MAASGVRSSWEASATNWRMRPSDSRSSDSVASRSANAFSIRPSMMLSARARRPTSVLAAAPGTRWSSSPAAIAPAVASTARSGRSPIRTSHQPQRSATRSAAPVTASSMSTRRPSVLIVSSSGRATTSSGPPAVARGADPKRASRDRGGHREVADRGSRCARIRRQATDVRRGGPAWRCARRRSRGPGTGPRPCPSTRTSTNAPGVSWCRTPCGRLQLVSSVGLRHAASDAVAAGTPPRARWPPAEDREAPRASSWPAATGRPG